MDHHHSEPDSVSDLDLTMRRYWELPDVYEFETEIREIDKNRVRLKENFFYPEGGGQPSDRGRLIFENTSYKIVDVQEEDDSVWLYGKDVDLEEGELVSAVIDKYRRETLTRNHSAQHLISAVMWDHFEYETTRALMELSETEVEFDQNPSLEILQNCLNLVNEYILRELPIETEFYDGQTIKTISVRGGYPRGHDIYRIVKIGDIDLNACGGTHLKRTSEIGTLAIRRIDGKRIKFMTGEDARKFYANSSMSIHALSRLLGKPPESIEEEVNRLLDQNSEYHKTTKDLNDRILQLELSQIETEEIGPYHFAAKEISELNRGAILSKLEGIAESEIYCFTNDSNGFIMVGGSEQVIQDLIKELRKQNVQGGGQGKVVMGKVPDGVNLKEQVSHILDQMS